MEYKVNKSEDEWEKWRNADAKTIITIPNMDQRAALLKIIGAQRILKELEAKKLDGPTEMGNTLWAVDGIAEGTQKVLSYTCPSTGHEYTKFVKPHYEKADIAQAESHHFTLETYLSLTQQA